MSSMTCGWSLSLEQFFSPYMSSLWSMRMMRMISATLESVCSWSNLGRANSRVWGMQPYFSSLLLMRLMLFLISPWMQSSQGALRSRQRMFFLQSISLKTWIRKLSLAAEMRLTAAQTFSEVSDSSRRALRFFSSSFSIFSQDSVDLFLWLTTKFSVTTSRRAFISALALSQKPWKKRRTYRFLELSELNSLVKFFMWSRAGIWFLMRCYIQAKLDLAVWRLSVRLESASTFLRAASMVLLIFLSTAVAFFYFIYIIIVAMGGGLEGSGVGVGGVLIQELMRGEWLFFGWGVERNVDSISSLIQIQQVMFRVAVLLGLLLRIEAKEEGKEGEGRLAMVQSGLGVGILLIATVIYLIGRKSSKEFVQFQSFQITHPPTPTPVIADNSLPQTSMQSTEAVREASFDGDNSQGEKRKRKRKAHRLSDRRRNNQQAQQQEQADPSQEIA